MFPSLGLYVHIPFCQSLCSYCNFHRGLFDAGLADRYVGALEREIRAAGSGEVADTIFFGGGTPSILEPGQIARIVAACRAAFTVTPDAEVTLETNPETVTIERMAGYLEAGVNRISLGAQSFDEAELTRLERVHSAGRIDEAVGAVRAAGFTNLSLDLMLWLPGQSRASWRRSLSRALALDPGHLSLYLLELYPNAPLREAMARQLAAPAEGNAAWAQAADDEAAEMYLEAFDTLETEGYRQYEISNAARAGLESRHNLKYWTSGEWWGFGSGAHSTVGDRRWQNLANTTEYVDRAASGVSVRQQEHTIGPGARVEEALFTGLRLSAGVDAAAFEARFGVDPRVAHAEVLAEAVDAGLVWFEAPRFGLTRAGMLVSNEVVQRFLAG
jgi:oxygen-independent coproporphyrinogen-3 oxidase